MAIDPKATAVYVGASAEGSWGLITDLDTVGLSYGKDAERRRFVFGQEAPYIKAGEKTWGAEMSGLYNPEDTAGQNVLRDAYDDDTTVFLAVVQSGGEYDGGDFDVADADGYVIEATITSYSENRTGDGDFVEVSFTAAGIPSTRATFSGGLPEGLPGGGSG
jgi:hypothetical protein